MSILTVGALSNCTKVAVVPVLPHGRWGLCFQSFLSPASAPSRTISLFPVFLGSSALYVCVWGGGGFWLEWAW